MDVACEKWLYRDRRGLLVVEDMTLNNVNLNDKILRHTSRRLSFIIYFQLTVSLLWNPYFTCLMF